MSSHDVLLVVLRLQKQKTPEPHRQPGSGGEIGPVARKAPGTDRKPLAVFHHSASTLAGVAAHARVSNGMSDDVSHGFSLFSGGALGTHRPGINGFGTLISV